MTTPAQRHVAVQLYRSILKAHKKHLPNIEMKQLGDAYVKSEFKVFKTVKDTKQLDEFYTSWNEYLNHILQTARRKQQVISSILDTTPTTSDVASPMSPSSATATTATTTTSTTSFGSFGKDLPIDMKFSEEQLIQLNNLKHEATKKK